MGQLEDFRASLKRKDSAESSEGVLQEVSGGEGVRREVM